MTPERQVIKQLLRLLGRPYWSFDSKSEQIFGAMRMANWLLECKEYDSIKKDIDDIHRTALHLRYEQ